MTEPHHPHQTPAGFFVATDELVNPASATGDAEDSSGPSSPDGVWGWMQLHLGQSYSNHGSWWR